MKKIELINVTRKSFPTSGTIVMTGDQNTLAILHPGDTVRWREDEDTIYYLRNNHWLKKLEIEILKPNTRANGHGRD